LRVWPRLKRFRTASNDWEEGRGIALFWRRRARVNVELKPSPISAKPKLLWTRCLPKNVLHGRDESHLLYRRRICWRLGCWANFYVREKRHGNVKPTSNVTPAQSNPTNFCGSQLQALRVLLAAIFSSPGCLPTRLRAEKFNPACPDRAFRGRRPRSSLCSGRVHRI